MGVFQFVVQLLYRSLLYISRLPRPVFSFIRRLFGGMDTSRKSVRQDRATEKSLCSVYDGSEECDSTWEDERDDQDTTEQSFWGPYRNIRAAKDMQSYRHYYRSTLTAPDDDEKLEEDDKDSPNVQFYRNKIHFYPNGVCIEEFHNEWFEDYNKLEYVHSYIQWLFPIQEKGMNYESQELSEKEIKLFHRDEEVKSRLLQSYKIMLNFYGIELVNGETGEVKRAENWRERFANLNRNTHNNLRITRILKCLGLLGFRHYQKPLVHFFLEETLVQRTLPRVKQSVLDYFMFAVVNKDERKELIKFAFNYFEPREEFVWCPRRIHKKFLKESRKSKADQNEVMSSDSTSQGDHNDLMDSRLQKRDEVKIDTKEDTSNEKSPIIESRNEENVSGECQESEKQVLLVTVAGNANTSDTSEGTKASSGVDSEHDGHKDSEDKAAIQKDDRKARNEKIPNSVQKATEKLDENGSNDADSTKETKILSADNSTAGDESTNENLIQTSNHSPTSENAAAKNSGSVQQDQENQEDESEQGNTDEFKSQYTDGDPKEKDSEEIQKSGSGSPEDGVTTGIEANSEANSAHYDAKESAAKNGPKHILSEEANASSIHLEQTSEQNSMSSKKIHTPGSDRKLEDEQEASDRRDELLNEAKAMGNPVEGSEQKNLGEKTLNQLEATTEEKEQVNEKKEDPLRQSNKNNTEDRLTNEGGSNITSYNNENSDSANGKNRDCTKPEEGTALMSDVNSSKDTETGQSSNEKSVEDEKTDGGTEKEENI